MNRFSIRRSVGTGVTSIRRSLGSLATKRRSSPSGFAEVPLDAFRGLPLLFVEDLRRGIESGAVAQGVQLFVAKANISNEIRQGMTFELVGMTSSRSQKGPADETAVEPDRLLGRGPFRSETFPFSPSEAREKPRSEWTVQDVSDFVVAANTFEQMVAKLGRRSSAAHKLGKRFQGAFVSYAGSSRFADLVDSLLDHFVSKGSTLSKEHVFLHMFNQHGRVMEASVLAEERVLLQQGLKVAIKSFDEVLVYMHSWAKPLPLARARCLWEIYGITATLRQSHVLTARGAAREFIVALETDFDNLVDSVTQPDIRLAKCNNEIHSQFIREAVDGLEGGADVLNNVVAKQLAGWLVQCTTAALVEFRKEEGVNMLQRGETQRCATVFSHAGRLMEELNEPLKAEALYREALRLLKQLDGADVAIAAVYGNIANALTALADYDNALSCYGQALARFTKTNNNANGQFDEQIALTLSRMARILAKLGDQDQALGHFEQSLEILRRKDGRDDLEKAFVLQGIAEVEIERGQFEQAFERLQTALNIRVRKLGKRSAEVAETLCSIGQLYGEQGQLDEALLWLRKALNTHRMLEGHAEVVHTLVAISSVYKKSGDRDSALRALREALAVGRMRLGDHDPIVPTVMLELGRLYEAEDTTKALQVYKHSLDLIRRASPMGAMQPAFAMALLSSASALEAKGDVTGATDQVVEAIHIYTQTLGEEHRQTVQARAILERLKSNLSL